jgi:amidohydrolase
MGPATDLEAVKARMIEEVDRRADLLVDVSHRIHGHPELNFEERFAHDLLAGVLEDEGLAVRRGAYGLETAFEVTVGDGDGPNVAVLLEYDALPGIGHACGHNVIAAAGLGAGLAAAAMAGEIGGRLVILGTPAEEGGGGKIHLADRGALAGLEAALMVHPAQHELARMTVIANHQVRVTYTGKAAHAAAAPWEGRNALDAAVLGYMNIAALRQHIGPRERVHGIITDGGDKPNIVPARAAALYYVRSHDLVSLEGLKERVLACLRAGAEAAGCEAAFEWPEPPYADMLHSEAILSSYVANAAGVGRTVLDGYDAPVVMGSTDMGNVSYEVPSIHPMIRVTDEPIPIHTPGFAACALAAGADRAVLDGAKVLAMTVADLWLRPDLLAAASAELAAQKVVQIPR